MAQAPVQLNSKNVKEQIEKNLKAILKDLPNYKAMVGIPASSNNKEGLNIAEYAFKNEFGTFTAPRIPSRPFLRTTLKGEGLVKFQKATQRFLNEVANVNKDTEGYLNKLALYVAGMVKTNIHKGAWVPNSPVTIAKKGSDKPLIDTGAMIGAVTAWVTKK